MPIIVCILILCVAVVAFTPILARINRSERLPVSVTALETTAPVVDAAENIFSQVFERPAQAGELATTGTDPLKLNAYPGLVNFAAMLANGNPDEVVGVYVNGIMALPVEQQPAGRPDFVSSQHNMLTQFSLPKEYGSVGILAHNFLSGSRFPQLREQTEIVLVYGSGRVDRYRVTRVERYQALKPTSPFSDFVDLSGSSGRVLTSAELFRRLYTTNHQLVFQTCIGENGESSWGRMFVVASPEDSLQLSIPGSLPPSRLN